MHTLSHSAAVLALLLAAVKPSAAQEPLLRVSPAEFFSGELKRLKPHVDFEAACFKLAGPAAARCRPDVQMWCDGKRVDISKYGYRVTAAPTRPVPAVPIAAFSRASGRWPVGFGSFVLAGTLLLVGDVKADPAQKELDALQGTWTVLTNESTDSKTDEEYNRRDGYRVVIKGNVWGWRSKTAGNHDVRFRLDPTKKPKQLDLDLRDGKPANEGLYELSGDELRVCIAHFGQRRPEQLAPSKKASLLVLRRLKK